MPTCRQPWQAEVGKPTEHLLEGILCPGSDRTGFTRYPKEALRCRQGPASRVTHPRETAAFEVSTTKKMKNKKGLASRGSPTRRYTITEKIAGNMTWIGISA